MLDGLWLVHPDEAMCAAFRHRFDGLPRVRVVRGRYLHGSAAVAELKHRRECLWHHDRRISTGPQPWPN